MTLTNALSQRTILLLLKVPYRRWQRWRPCHARAVCLLSPWWDGLGLRYPPNMYIDCPNTSVFVVLLLVSLLLFQLPLVPLNLAFSWHVQRNQAAFAWSSSLTYVEILQLSELLCLIWLIICSYLPSLKRLKRKCRLDYREFISGFWWNFVDWSGWAWPSEWGSA